MRNPCDFMLRLPSGRCHPCEYAKPIVASGQWFALGCFAPPYKGKWVAEIKDCPIGRPVGMVPEPVPAGNDESGCVF